MTPSKYSALCRTRAVAAAVVLAATTAGCTSSTDSTDPSASEPFPTVAEAPPFVAGEGVFVPSGDDAPTTEPATDPEAMKDILAAVGGPDELAAAAGARGELVSENAVSVSAAIDVLSSGAGNMASQQLTDLLTADLVGVYNRRVGSASEGADIRVGLLATPEAALRVEQLMAGPTLTGVGTEIPSPVSGTRAFMTSVSTPGGTESTYAIQMVSGRIWLEVSTSGPNAALGDIVDVAAAQKRLLDR